MAINQLDMGRVFSNALATGAAYKEMQQREQQRNWLADNGQALMAGDPNALAGYAQYNPQAALAMQNSMAGERRAADLYKRQVAEYAANKSAAELQAEIQKTDQVLMGAAHFYENKDPRGYTAFLVEQGIDPRKHPFEQFPAHARMFKGARDVLAEIVERQTPEYGVANGSYYDKNNPGAGAKPIPDMPGKPPLATIELPGGGSVTVGGSGVPGGQNPAATSTPRDSGTLSKEMSKEDAAALSEMGAAARSAANIGSLATQLESVAGKVGYTGPGGNLYGRVDDAVRVLPGDSGARGAFKSLAMEAQLSFTEKTKGAITDREMGMFREAVPNLGQTEDGNKAIAQVMRAGAKRVQTRFHFFEEWARKHGSLEGADAVWAEYMDANPILSDAGETIAVNNEGDWRAWLNRKPANAYTPEAIMQMNEREIVDVPIESMTPAQLDALELRYNQLKGAQ